MAGAGEARKGKRVIDGTLVAISAAVAVLCALAFQRGGAELVREGLGAGVGLLLRFGLLIVLSFLAAGLAEQLVSQEWLSGALGEGSGLRGIVIAAVAGVLTPAGPFVSMPIAAVMLRSGATSGAVVAFVSSWSLLALHRFVAWEVPILGFRFALLRYGACLVLPVIAGVIARALARS